MTISKTLEKAKEFKKWDEWDTSTSAEFAEFILQEATAELQKENARLTEALRTLSTQAAAPIDRHIAYTALNPPKGGAVQQGLSKEKAK